MINSTEGRIHMPGAEQENAKPVDAFSNWGFSQERVIKSFSKEQRIEIVRMAIVTLETRISQDVTLDDLRSLLRYEDQVGKELQPTQLTSRGMIVRKIRHDLNQLLQKKDSLRIPDDSSEVMMRALTDDFSDEDWAALLERVATVQNYHDGQRGIGNG